MEFQRNDAMLMEILTERSSITEFLDAIFGFLRRNSDFYHTKNDAFDKIGFPKGMREQLVFSAMQRYDTDSFVNAMSTTSSVKDNDDFVPPAVEEITVETEEQHNSNVMTDINLKAQNTTIQKTEMRFAPSDYKNGAVFEEHCWSQTLKDLEVHVHLPPNLTSSKKLCVDIGAQRLKISSRIALDQVILEGVLSQRIRHNEAVWTVDRNMLLISCDKTKELLWDRLFESDAEIDVKKLNCERYLDEYPQNTQMEIEKLCLQQVAADQQNKQPIAPPANTEQAKILDRLRVAWDADGSPFKGQPFDPSVVQMS